MQITLPIPTNTKTKNITKSSTIKVSISDEETKEYTLEYLYSPTINISSVSLLQGVDGTDIALTDNTLTITYSSSIGGTASFAIITSPESAEITLDGTTVDPSQIQITLPIPTDPETENITKNSTIEISIPNEETREYTLEYLYFPVSRIASVTLGESQTGTNIFLRHNTLTITYNSTTGGTASFAITTSSEDAEITLDGTPIDPSQIQIAFPAPANPETKQTTKNATIKVSSSDGETQYTLECQYAPVLSGNFLPITSLTAQIVEHEKVLLHWFDHNQETVTQIVERKNKNADDSTYQTIATLSNGETTYQDTGLTANSGYTYRIKSDKGTETVYSIEKTIQTTKTSFTMPKNGIPDGTLSYYGDLQLNDQGKTDLVVSNLTSKEQDGTVGTGGIQILVEFLMEVPDISAKKFNLGQLYAPDNTTPLEDLTLIVPPEETENFLISGFTYIPTNPERHIAGKGFVANVWIRGAGIPREPADAILGSIDYPEDLPSSPVTPSFAPGTESQIMFTAPTLTILTYLAGTGDEFSHPSDRPDSYLVEGSEDKGSTWYKLAMIPAYDGKTFLTSPSYDLPANIRKDISLRITSSNITGYSTESLEFNLSDL